jgi:hypothetical protein
MTKEKTHYRKVFKSDHLGVADLEDFIEAKSNLVFTIKHVRQEIGVQVAGRKINANIAYFNESIKPLVLNATNSKAVKVLCGGSPFVEDWVNLPVQLYIDPNAKLKGEIVGGVRVHPDAPKVKQVLTPQSANWQSAVDAYKRDGSLENVLRRATISREHQQIIMGTE